MNEKLLISLNSLANWCEKILEESIEKEFELNDFVRSFNINDFIKFYKELMPFVLLLKSENEELFCNHIAGFQQNLNKLEGSIESNWFMNLCSIFFAASFNDFKATEKVKGILKDTFGETQNLIYSLKIYN